MKYKECRYCGATLDFGESCDCEERLEYFNRIHHERWERWKKRLELTGEGYELDDFNETVAYSQMTLNEFMEVYS